jgi:hypothetical protein
LLLLYLFGLLRNQLFDVVVAILILNLPFMLVFLF